MKKRTRTMKLQLTRETLRNLTKVTGAANCDTLNIECISNCPGECEETAHCGGISEFCGTDTGGCDPATGSRILCFPTQGC